MAHACARSLLVVLAGLCSACGGPAPALARVNGRLTLEGQGLVDVVVTFWPQDHEAAPTRAVPSSGGLFRLRCRPGTYKITVGPLTSDTVQGPPLGPVGKTGGPTIPAYYHDVRTTPFQVEVPEKGTDAAIFDVVRGKGKR